MQSNIDDVPVGGGSNTGPSANMEEFAQTSENKIDNTGPLEQRIVSKNWLIRATAFEEIGTLFKNADTPFDAVYQDHSSEWKKYLADNNPGSLEKCLDSLTIFIDRADPKLVNSFQNDIIKVLIEKCVGHAKPTIKQKSLECFNLLFEVTESFDDSIETMTEMLNSKNQKISQSALVTLNSWLSSYGVKKIKIKSFLSIIEKAATSTVPAIRNEGMNFYKEAYKFLGDGLKPLLANLKKQQLDDLEKVFQELKDQPKNLRLTRSDKQKAKDAQLDEIIKKEAEESKDDAALDLYEPVDILAKYNGEWQDKIIELKNWKEKKDQLEELYNESNVPKIKPGDFSGLAKVVKKLIGDANVVVCQMAVKVCGSLAKGLRKDFEPCTKELLPTLIGKFKEKKTQLIEEIHQVLENFLLCTNLEFICQEVIAGLQDKAPTVRINICLFIEKAAQQTYIDVLQRVSGEIVGILSKMSDDPAGDVRNSALSCMGIFKGRLGDSAMSKYLQDLNPQKLQKLNESAQNVKPSKYDRPEKQEIKAAPPSKGPPAKGKPAAKTVPKKKESAKIEEVEDAPISAKESSNNFDEIPIGGKKSSNTFDDMPIGGGNKGNQFDDMPIGGGNKGGFDDQPLGGGGKMGGGGYNLDDLDESAFGGKPSGDALVIADKKPARKPPARFAQKTNNEEEKKEGSDDVVMADETPKVEEKKKAPPKIAEKKPTTTTTAKPAGKAAGGQMQQDEEAGGGLSKEEAEAKVIDTFGADVAKKFEESKWQDKVEGFKAVGEQLSGMQPGGDVIEAVVRFVKMKMKDWKESNINIIKEAIALFTLIQQNCEKVGKRSVYVMMPFLSEKIGDVKLMVSVGELLMGLSELVTPKYVALQIIKHASSAKSPNVLKESCNILHRMTDEFGVINMPLKEMIDYAIIAVNHSNPQVRTSAMALFAMMYKHAGEAIKNFLKDIKESTMKLIEEEFGKVTPYKKGEYQRKRGFRGEAAVEEAGPAAGGKKGGGGGGLDDLLPRTDISKQITAKLIPMFKHNDWKVRKEAADKVEEILKQANMRIQPTGLNELMDNMKQRMVDPNKAVLKAYVQLMCVLVEALGEHSRTFSKKLLPPMLANLADKQSLVRADVVVAMDKWAEHAGPEVIISIGGPLVSQENPELRTEMLKWIIKNKDAIKKSEVKDLIKPLVQCLSDKTPAIRNMAEEVITYVMPITGYAPFQPVISDLLPAVQNALKPLLEKIKVKVGATTVAQDTMMASTGKPAAQQQPEKPQQQVPSGPTLKKQDSIKPQIKPKTNQPPQEELPKPTPKLNQTVIQQQQPQQQQQVNQSTILKKKEPQQNQTPQLKQRSESKEAQRPKGLGASITSLKQEEPQMPQEVPVTNVNFGFKDKRAEYDRKNKFQLEEVKGDQVEKLKVFTTQALGLGICQKMFTNDFKIHIDCIEMFNTMIQTNPDGLKEILDVVFKWACVKLNESNNNTKFAVAVFDFYAGLFQSLEEAEYQIADVDANIVIPFLCEKAGNNNNILKDKVKKLVKMVYGIYDKQKAYNLIVAYGLNSKNLRAQAECLDELAYFLINFGIDYSAEKEMKLVAKMADSADKSVRENALVFMGEAYKLLDDSIWRVIGDVTPKVQGLLEQRFKKLKGGTGLGLAQSSSSSNLQLSNHLARDGSPSTAKNEGNKAQSTFGAKKPVDLGKSITTPRNTNLQMNKQLSAIQKPSTDNVLSRSINQFNQSNKSNEESKKTPQGIPKKQDMLKKVLSQDNQAQISGIGQKKAIPQTQRPSDSQGFDQQVQRGSEPTNNYMKSSFAGLKAQQQQTTKNTQMFYQNDDDDEDLRILTNDDNFGDPELDKLQDEITKHIHQLKYADLSKRVDSLVSLNEMISAIDVNRPVLVRAANDLVSAFTHVLNDIFDKNVEDIPLRFAKYFITIVLKTCSCKEIMREVNEEKMFDLAEQLLTRLLIDNLDKVGDNKEGELILKNLNSSMLRLLENCNHTYIFCVLFNLLRKYKDYPLMPKLPNLIIKCLLKLSKILEKLIDKLDIEKILLAIHEYLVVINHDNKTQNDEMGIRIVKTVTNELVKLRRESIWEAYRVIQCHNQPDNHIFRWIQIILKSLQTQGSSTPTGGSTASNGHAENEIRMIVEELRNPEKFENAIPKLQRFLDQNPQIDLNDYLHECSKTFQQFIKTNLEKHRANMKEENKQQQEYGMMDSMKSTNNSDNQPQSYDENQRTSQVGQTSSGNTNRISEYQSKLASIKQRNMKGSESVKAADVGGGVSGSHSHQLNTSFSAMNSSLSQKWQEINNKKSGLTKREGGTQQMSSTMTGFGSGSNALGQGNFESKIGKGQNIPMNQSIGAGSSGDQNSTGGGATNQDLNKRLAEMKAKLQALKKK